MRCSIFLFVALLPDLVSCDADVSVAAGPPAGDVTSSSSGGDVAVDAGADDASDGSACAAGERYYRGECCAPLTCGPGVCGPQSDGCELIADCDFVCGDGLWMFCGALKRCICSNAHELPGGDDAERLCEERGGRQGYACGDTSADAPAGCEEQPETIGDGPRLWCCE